MLLGAASRTLSDDGGEPGMRKGSVDPVEGGGRSGEEIDVVCGVR